MSSIEEKILDGPRAHYCDAENDDIRTGEDADSDEDCSKAIDNCQDASSLFVRPDDSSENSGKNRVPSFSRNTGPKGVIEDYKKRSQPATRQNTQQIDEIDAEFERLMQDDTILQEFASKRISQEKVRKSKYFGHVLRLETGGELLDSIDREDPDVLVVVHIYVKYSKSCAKVDRCLDQLASEFKNIKFVTLDASVAGLSSNFKENGVPALLAYRGGDLVRSLVKLEELLDTDFEISELRNLLNENGLL